MKRSSARMDRVDTPIIPTIAALVRDNPGTISLGQGVVSYGPPADAVAALPGLMADVQLNKYQAVSGYGPLVEEIQAKLARENGIVTGDQARIMVTAGSNMAFLNAVLAVADPGDEFILPTPFYFNQEMAIRMGGCVPVPVPTRDDWQLDVAALAAAITPRTRAIVTRRPTCGQSTRCARATGSTTSATRPTSTSPTTRRATSRRPRSRARTRKPCRSFPSRRTTAWPAGGSATWCIRPTCSMR
jgi:DNA-binding transcriptional MocR family regulator